MAEAVNNEILKYWPLLDIEERQSILGIVKSFMKLKNKEDRISAEQYTKELDEAIARVASGKFTTHEDVIKESKAW